MSKTAAAKDFLITFKICSSQKAAVTADFEIKSEDTKQFHAVLKLHFNLILEDGFCIKDADIQYLGIEVINNTLLPEEELDFYSQKNSEIFSQYSQVAKNLVRQIDDYAVCDFLASIRFKAFLL